MGFLKSFFRGSKNNKENSDLNKTTGFTQSNRGRQALKNHNGYDDDDEPVNPYHAPAQPRRNYRATRSVAGGERIDDRYSDFNVGRENASFDGGDAYFNDRANKSRHDHNRHSQKRSSKHYRNQKTSEYGSGEASPARFHYQADSDSENGDHYGHDHRDVVDQRLTELHREIRDLKNNVRTLKDENDELRSRNRGLQKDKRELERALEKSHDSEHRLKAKLREGKMNRASHATHFTQPVPSRYAGPHHVAPFDLHPMNQSHSLFEPHGHSSYRPPSFGMNQNFSPLAASTSTAGAGEALANQSSHFTNMAPMGMGMDRMDHDELGDEMKVFREMEESSEINETVSLDESLNAERMREGTPIPFEFHPQQSASSITLVEDENVSPHLPKRAHEPKMNVKRSLSFN
ncbi:hypothetical protein L596_002198 [Steinernema carpocapsae]|uniref:Uncharacterized protein n=1 Tax=Steinernema carpocapsae TaxID=34508 RepID=A0A4V6I7M1_STECR|nr:hypothetical protein L596_002198 [Steinernema carpocapsae]